MLIETGINPFRACHNQNKTKTTNRAINPSDQVKFERTDPFILTSKNPLNQRGQMRLWYEVRHVLFILSPGSLIALSAQQSQLGMHLCATADVVITS